MVAARQYANTERERRAKKQGRRVRPVMLHLLVPAYQPIVIAEALKIPEEIGDFAIEGRVNSNKPFVWMNLPEEQRNYVVDVGQWVPPTPGWWEFAMSKLGLTEQPLQLKGARVLGQSQHPMDSQQLLEETSTEQIEAENEGAIGTQGALAATDRGKDGAQRRKNATPLHQRRRKHTK
jgi:hypothetical protein